MPSFRRPRSMSTIAGRSSIPALAAGALLFAAGAAAAACPVPRITQLSEKNGPNCGAVTCGFIIVHWVGNPGCSHYNIRETSGTQFEAPGTNRGQLHNQRSAQFPGRFTPNNTIHVIMQGCTRNFFGQSSCGAWSSPPVSFRINDSMTSPRGKFCGGYAERAVGTVKYAQEQGCDRKVISGARWSSSFDDHRSFCMKASANSIRTEERARASISQKCRIEAGMPKGTPGISVTSKGGDTFVITGTGLLKNTPMIIVVSGPGSVPQRISAVKGQRIITTAKGELSVTLFGAQVCKRGGGQIVFTAEDQDRKPSKPVTTTCAP